MSRSKLRAGLAAFSLGALAVVATPATANASPFGANAVVTPASTTPADGYFYGYYDPNYSNLCGKFYNSSPTFGSCQNAASSLWNNGYSGSYGDVKAYWGANYTGSWGCVYNGVAVVDLADETFYASGTGQGETANNNIASIKWTTC
jgi:hypothetical protein